MVVVIYTLAIRSFNNKFTFVCIMIIFCFIIYNDLKNDQYFIKLYTAVKQKNQFIKVFIIKINQLELKV